MLPEQLRSKVVLVGGRTRQAENIVIQSRKTKCAQKSLFYEGIQMYNAIPADVKQCDRIVLFKRKLIEFIRTSIPSM
ncbi:hypothetical protein WN55_03582 [Dufourea novaeangliae]|uniref:Uncharacterized protein n=1 Tax=Dufourea novaeangliae TaxID=178035 RepID=A0A154PIT8_DUFNO|nr:hypothetical protein WN55_03582 [Dufourea novaeangliae]